MKSFYITTTLPYVNAEPHIGFAMELVRADIIARQKKLQGFDVFLNTGTDEHGQKIFENSMKSGKDTQEFVDENAKKFKDLKSILGLSEDLHFVRTTDEYHLHAAEEFWKKCNDAGDIYKKNYKIKYCVGCELEKQDSEIVNGHCELHPNMELEIREEENYFFKFSKFQKPLLDFYNKNPDFVIPGFRFNEIKAFVERGLEDFSISRLKEKMSWGIPVPGDDKHVMYVWFDALVSYISTLGWPENTENFEKFWKEGTPVQYCGKDNLRQQSAMWQAMLMSAGLPNSKHIVINGFITGNGGVKMSKSLGNTVNPVDLVSEYGTDAVRYFLARELSNFEDSPFTMERFKDSYNANLANGLGNLVSRVLTMAEKFGVSLALPESSNIVEIKNFNIVGYMSEIWDKISNSDKKIQEKEPFKLFKTDPDSAMRIISDLLLDLYHIAKMLEPAMPETSQKILDLIKDSKKPEKPLFLRKD